MSRIYIGKKFEDGTWYNLYYDNVLKMISLVDPKDPDLEWYYSSTEEDIAAMASKIYGYKIIRMRESKLYKQRMKNKIWRFLCISLFVGLSGFAISKLSDPIIQYNLKYIVTEEDERDDISLSAINEMIDNNETINVDFKNYLKSFFKRLKELDYSYNASSVNRILNNIKNKDFKYVKFDDQDSIVAGLAEVIGKKSQISILMLSLEYYEFYYDLDASFKTRLFDAINARSEDNLAFGIIDGCDEYYSNYLCEKYGITQEKADSIMSFLSSSYSYVGYNYEKYENYINSILAFNYNFGGNFLHGLDDNTTYNGLASGNNKYSYNIFGNLIKLGISYGGYSYDTYYDTEYGINVTSSEYYKKFLKLIDNFDSDIDINNHIDRMLIYLYTIAGLECDLEKGNSYNEYMFRVGEYYFDDNLYSFLSGNNYNAESISSHIIMLCRYSELDEDDLVLLNESLICLNREVSIGALSPEDFELLFKEISIRINECFDKETFLKWQDNIISCISPDNIGDIIDKYKDKESRLTKHGN